MKFSDILRTAIHDDQRAVDSTGHEAGRIQLPCARGQPARPDRSVAGADLRDLIADGVGEDAGVGAGAANHRVEIPFPPFDEVVREVVIGLRPCPHVGELVHHQHAQAIASAEHRAAHRLMGAAQCVESRSLQYLHPPLVRPADVRGADHAVVMVHAGTTQLHRLAVHTQPAHGIQLERADAERDPRLIHAVVADQLDGDGVEVGAVRAPQPRRGDEHTLAHQGVLSRGDAPGRDVGGDERSVGVEDADADVAAVRVPVRVADCGVDLDDCIFLVDLGSSREHPVEWDVNGVRDVKVNL